MRGARIGAGLAFAAHRNSGDGVRSKVLLIGLGDNMLDGRAAKVSGEGVRDTSCKTPGDVGNGSPSCSAEVGLLTQTLRMIPWDLASPLRDIAMSRHSWFSLRERAWPSRTTTFVSLVLTRQLCKTTEGLSS